MKLILGTMTFGPQVNLEDSELITSTFLKAGYKEIDTAYVYNKGDTEIILGKIIANTNIANEIATKVNPRITGKLDRKSILNQFNESLNRLNVDKIDLLYLHFPDPVTPLEETLGALAELIESNKIKEFGLSNFPAWMVVEVCYLCKMNNWPLPSVYQGMYNGLSRNVEKELFPVLRKFGLRFYAFNPLAGGLLSGKYDKFDENPVHGRFTLRPNYQDRYWKKSFFDALQILTKECNKFGITSAEAAYRWLAFHSQLDKDSGDGIIIGVSKIKHLEQNIATINKGELPELIVKAFEEAWLEAKTDSPDYYRFLT